jgi:hypothetical protein
MEAEFTVGRQAERTVYVVVKLTVAVAFIARSVLRIGAVPVGRSSQYANLKQRVPHGPNIVLNKSVETILCSPEGIPVANWTEVGKN